MAEKLLPSLSTQVSALRAANALRIVGEYIGDMGSERTPTAPLKSSGLTRTRGALVVAQDPSIYLLFQFNPEELSHKTDVVYEDRSKPGIDAVSYIWVKGGAREFSFELFLDATEGSRTRYLGKSGEPDVTATDKFTHDPSRGILNQWEFLHSLTRPFIPQTGYSQDPFIGNLITPRFVRGSGQALTTDRFSNPPEVIFVFGSFYFHGVITGLTDKFNLFNSQLVPLRGTVNVTFRVKEGVNVTIDPNIANISGTQLASPNITDSNIV